MKRVYPFLLAVCICMMAAFPRISLAQCNCAPGVPATAIPYTATMDSLTAVVATIKFPKFNPSIGDLSCVSINYNITSVLSFTLENLLSIPYTYQFDYTQYSGLNDGIGLFASHSVVRTYGPYNLLAHPNPADSVRVGPDTLFNNSSFSATNNSSLVGYQSGIPNDSFAITYDNSYSTHFTAGSNNFSLLVNGYAKGIFNFTYYWCPHVILATSIKNFTATQNGDAVLLKWLTDNEQNNTNYEIQISSDGKNFNSIGQPERDPASAGVTAKYQYQHHLDHAPVGKLYFRVKETDATGKVSYSAIVILRPGGGGDEPVSYQAYPNPATNSLIFQFNSNQTGRYMLELVNTAGQVVQQKNVTLTGTSQIRLDLNPHPAKGLYYLRAMDQTHNQHYTTKVLIN